MTLQDFDLATALKGTPAEEMFSGKRDSTTATMLNRHTPVLQVGPSYDFFFAFVMTIVLLRCGFSHEALGISNLNVCMSLYNLLSGDIEANLGLTDQEIALQLIEGQMEIKSMQTSMAEKLTKFNERFEGLDST